MLAYSFSGDFDEYKTLLRKFTLDQLLMRINFETSELLRNEHGSFALGVKSASYPLINYSTKERSTQNVYVTGWNLIDLAYYAICSSNDFRGKKIDSEKELYLLVSATDSVHQKRESYRIDQEDLHEYPNLFFYVWGFFGEQMKVETPGKVFANLSRELYILLDIAPKNKKISAIKDIVYNEVGVNLENVLTSLFLAWFASTVSPLQEAWEKHFAWNETLPLVDFQKVLTRYTATYDDVRSSQLKRQFLYTKPFIATQKKQTLSINCYLNLFLIEHCILWIVRDYYLKLGDQRFTSEFGVLFESYFQELLSEYLTETQFDKIPENTKKRADWKLQLGKYKFLIEQKSPSLSLAAKQQESNVNTVKNFCERNIVEAIDQLHSTEEDFADGQYIKMILLYEDYLQTNILDHVFTLPACKQNNDGYYWLVTIDEIETLLHLFKNNRALFDAVMGEKINREVTQSKEGKSLSQIFSKYGISENPHLSQGKFKKHLDALKEHSTALLPDKHETFNI